MAFLLRVVERLVPPPVRLAVVRERKWAAP